MEPAVILQFDVECFQERCEEPTATSKTRPNLYLYLYRYSLSARVSGVWTPHPAQQLKATVCNNIEFHHVYSTKINSLWSLQRFSHHPQTTGVIL